MSLSCHGKHFMCTQPPVASDPAVNFKCFTDGASMSKTSHIRAECWEWVHTLHVNRFVACLWVMVYRWLQ